MTSGADHDSQPTIIRVVDSVTCCDPEWEAAYLRFESPQREVAKFRQRLERLGVQGWDRNSAVVELFCGRGNALQAWTQLGFSRLEGIDLSEELLRQYRGPATLYVSDARRLPFEADSRDIVAVQGGLHHLASLSELEQTLRSIARVLRPAGRLVAVEPWLTPFLRAVHGASRSRLIRRMNPRIDAFAIMVERERDTYERWLAQPTKILALLREHFQVEQLRTRLGKLEFVGRRR